MPKRGAVCFIPRIHDGAPTIEIFAKDDPDGLDAERQAIKG